MKVLIVAAHADDEVYGMGGTISKLTKLGHEVKTLIVTDSCSSQYRTQENLSEILLRKKDEAKKANDLLGVSEVIFADLPDMKLSSAHHVDINQVIEQVVIDFQPQVVYTHFYGDVNRDHQEVYKSTLVACRPTCNQCVKKLIAYSVPSATEWSPQHQNSIFLPNLFEDIRFSSEEKYKAIEVYQTEIRPFPHPRSIEYVKKMDEREGLTVGLAMAESFMILREVIL